MRNRLVVLACAGMVAVIAGCQPGQTKPPQEVTGAPTPRGAVERFLAAVRGQDLQALGVVWGSKAGPARVTVPREELERREVIMTQCLANDSASFLDENAAPEGRRQVRFVLHRGGIHRTTAFTTESGPLERWYVVEIDLRDTHSCTVEGGPQGK